MKWFVHQAKDVNSLSIKGWIPFSHGPMSLASFLHPDIQVTVSKAVSDDINEKKKEAEVWVKWADAPTQRVHSFWDDVFYDIYGSIEVLDRAVYLFVFFPLLNSLRRDLGGSVWNSVVWPFHASPFVFSCLFLHHWLMYNWWLLRLILPQVTEKNIDAARESYRPVAFRDFGVAREGVTNQEWKGHIDDTFLGGKNVNETWKMITSLCGTTDLFRFQLV